MRKSFIFLIVFLIFGFGIFLWQGVYLSRSELALLRGLPKNSQLVEEKLFLVEKGQNLFQIAEKLEKEGLIKNKFLFDFWIFIKRSQKKLQAGEYSLSPSMSIAEIAQKIISGDVAKIKITIPEGFNLKQVEEKLNLSLRGLKVKDFKSEFGFLNDAPAGASLEGFLFPDTYILDVSMGNKEIAEAFLKNFDKKLAPYRNEVSDTGLTVYEIITMASLIEKEVKTFEDKKVVSGILWKRLKAGIPLQVDATISYITGESTTKISIEDTKIDSPYNTYKYLGLPKGPICNPGLDSILTALHPKSSECWYYLSTPEGKTIFSRTLEEHNIAKAKYLK